MFSSKIKKVSFCVQVLIFAGLILAGPVFAVCPVCTVAVGACLGLSRWLGVDDSISGVWVGGLIISLTLWFLNWLRKKEIHFKFRKTIVFLSFYAIAILPLYWTGIMGHPFNKFYGIDKLLVGIIFGSLSFIIALWLNYFLKKKNQGKQLFSFQKVVLPLLLLLVTSLFFYFLTKCKT